MLLDVRNLSIDYRKKSGTLFRAVHNASLHIDAAESVGIVGESGCGKSSLARAILGLIPSSEGEILFQGRPLSSFRKPDWASYRGNVQMVFQDSLGTLNPRMSIGTTLREAVQFHLHDKSSPRSAIHHRVQQLLELVELSPSFVNRFPHELSGGQRQRISIARALAANPKLVVADEPVSALDVSIQARVIHLLERLRSDLGVAFLFIAHDLAVVRALCPRAYVMNAGHIVESGPTSDLFTHPREPYTQTLLAAVPDIRRALAERSLP